MRIAEGTAVSDFVRSERSPVAFANRDVASTLYVQRDITAYSQLESPPRWLRQARAKLQELSRLPANWNSYGSSPVTVSATQTAYQLLREMATHATPFPALVPTSDGSVQIEWHTRGIDLELRILSPTRIAMSFEDLRNGSAPVEVELQYDLTELKKALEMLSARAA